MTREEIRAKNREKWRRRMANPATREKIRLRDEARKRARGVRPRPTAEQLAAAFWAKAVTVGDCLEWRGTSLGKEGFEYGVVKRRGRRILAHRMAYELTHGSVPDGMFVCHRCDNPSCIKPDHLFVGDQTDNMRDCANKGRLRGTFRKGPNGRERA